MSCSRQHHKIESQAGGTAMEPLLILSSANVKRAGIQFSEPAGRSDNNGVGYEYFVFGDDGNLYFRSVGSAAGASRNITVTIMSVEYSVC